MSSKASSSGGVLAPDLVLGLRAVEKAKLSSAAVIEQRFGHRARASLPILFKEGYVQKLPGLQRDGQPTTLYSLTPFGKIALSEARHAEVRRMIPARRPSRAARSSFLDTQAYDGCELRPFIGRSGAMDAFSFPSRIGARLHHPDGTITPAGEGCIERR